MMCDHQWDLGLVRLHTRINACSVYSVLIAPTVFLSVRVFSIKETSHNNFDLYLFLGGNRCNMGDLGKHCWNLGERVWDLGDCSISACQGLLSRPQCRYDPQVDGDYDEDAVDMG